MTDTGAFADWSPVAVGWDKYRDSIETLKADLTDRMLRALALQPGEAVLELGGGAGELAKRLSAAVGATGRVVASDISPGMVELISAATAELPNVRSATIDGADTGEPDAAYDAIVFRMGLMFVLDPAAALRDYYRILKPGGRLAAATWAGMEHNPWLTTVGMAGMIHGVLSGGPPIGPGGPLSLGDPQALAAMATAAGFQSVEVTPVEVVMDFPDVDAYIAHVSSLAPPFAAAFPTATEEQLSAVKATVTETTKQFRTESGIALPGRALLLIAAASRRAVRRRGR
jgi:SAM-dependent methyltransferase